MRGHIASRVAGVVVVLLFGCSNSPRNPTRDEPSSIVASTTVETTLSAQVNKVRLVILPAGTLIRVRTIDYVDSRRHRVGQTFVADVDADVVIDDEIVVQRRADAVLRLVRVSSGPESGDKSKLQLQLDRILVDGNSYVVVSRGIEVSASDQQILVPPETRLVFRLEQPVKVAVVIRPAT